MKIVTFLNLIALILLLDLVSANGQSSLAGGPGGSESRTLVAIKADGSSVVTHETIQPRQSLVLQVRSWERFSKPTAGEEAPPAPAAVKPDEKPLSNEELGTKVREMYQQRPEFDEGTTIKIENVEGATNLVRLVTTHAMASLKDLLGKGPWSWGPSMLMYEDARLEMGTNQSIRLTFIPSKEAQRYGAKVSRQWKTAKMKAEWKLLLPGKILTSGLSETQTNATWLRLDGEKPETIEAAQKLLSTPLVITAEAGGLKLEEKLESKKLARAVWLQGQTEPDLPITDAGPGFVAEPLGLTILTAYYFPEGEQLRKDGPVALPFGLESPGTVVAARLLPPKGRIIRNVSELKVKRARDDKDRIIPLRRAGEAGDEDNGPQYVFSGSEDENGGGAARIELRFGLPAADAQSIDWVEAEAVVLSISGWKEITLTNVLADDKKEIDLAELLPGAKMIVRKLTMKQPQIMVEAALDGPPAINQLDVRIKTNRRGGGSSHVMERPSSGGKKTRNVTVQGYVFSLGESAGKDSPVTLQVRFPQDLKRERVRIRLSALDLL